MRISSQALACVLCFLSVPALAQRAVPEAIKAQYPIGIAPVLSPMSLTLALEKAAESSPAIRNAQALLTAAEGQLSDARAILANNPQLSIESTQRSLPQPPLEPENRNEWSAGISQTFEIGGQGRHRRETAEANLEALSFQLAEERRQVRSDVSSRFYQVLALQQRVELESQSLKMLDEAAGAVETRRRAGEDTRLDANVAMVEAERARNQLALSQEQLAQARTELASRLQLGGATLPLALGDLTPTPIQYSVDQLLASLERRPGVLAKTARERSAKAKYQLERSSAVPDVTVGLNFGNEGPSSARERLTTLSVSIPVPFFKRNKSGISEAMAQSTLAQIERESSQRDSRTNVLTLWARLKSQEQRVSRLQQSVLPALTENQSLSAKSRQAGQIGLLEMLVVNRQALDARRDLVEALSEYHSTRAELELAAGWPNE